MRAEATRDTTPTGAVIAASLLVTGLLAAHPVVGQEPREERAGSVTPEQFDRWMTELSNWGRWGPDDELGTLNLVTGAWERRTGVTISSGDALFLRTAGSGGYHNSIMPFIRERDVLAPLTVPNGAGAAINPIAVF